MAAFTIDMAGLTERRCVCLGFRRWRAYNQHTLWRQGATQVLQISVFIYGRNMLDHVKTKQAFVLTR